MKEKALATGQQLPREISGSVSRDGSQDQGLPSGTGSLGTNQSRNTAHFAPPGRAVCAGRVSTSHWRQALILFSLKVRKSRAFSWSFF